MALLVDHPLTESLEPFQERGYSYSLVVEHMTVDNVIEQHQVIDQGTPTGTAASARLSVTLYEDDELVGPYDDRTVEEADTYFADNVGSGNEYTTVDVYLILWR